MPGSRLLHELGQLEEAATLGAEAVSRSRRSTLKATRWNTGSYLASYGRTLIQLERYTEADRALLEAHEILTFEVGDDHAETFRAVGSLVDLYTAWHAAEPNQGYEDKAPEWRTRLAELEAGRTFRDR